MCLCYNFRRIKELKTLGCILMCKDDVPIPPLIMQDDTLTVSACGIKTHKMNTLINTHASMMGLQFGSEKCVRIHIG